MTFWLYHVQKNETQHYQCDTIQSFSYDVTLNNRVITIFNIIFKHNFVQNFAKVYAKSHLILCVVHRIIHNPPTKLLINI